MKNLLLALLLFVSVAAVGQTTYPVTGNPETITITDTNTNFVSLPGRWIGKAFDLIYLIKNTFGSGAGNINVNGAGAVGYTTGTKEAKVSGTVNGSGYIDVVMTQTASNTSECMVAIILIIYP